MRYCLRSPNASPTAVILSGVGEGEAEDHFVSAGLDVTRDQAGNLVRLADGEPAISSARGAAAASISRTSAVFWLDVVRISGVIPCDADLSGVTADLRAVAMQYADLAGQGS